MKGNKTYLVDSDLESLKPGECLNSSVIRYAIENEIEKLGLRKEFYLFDPLVASLIVYEDDEEDLRNLLIHVGPEMEGKIVICPLNDNTDPCKSNAGNHWTLLIWRGSQPSSYLHMCSMNKGPPNSALILTSKISGQHEREIIKIDITETQKTYFDCGLFVIHYALSLISNLEVLLSKFDDSIAPRLTCLFQENKLCALSLRESLQNNIKIYH